METVVILNYGPYGKTPGVEHVEALKLIDERVVARSICRVEAGACYVSHTEVAETHRHKRFSAELAYELERRWPGRVTFSLPKNEGQLSFPWWFDNFERIMAEGPHIDRPDLPTYVPTTLPKDLATEGTESTEERERGEH